jgi:hypothetical protein
MDFLDQNLQNNIHLAMFRQNILEHIFIILKFILIATNDSVPKQVVQLFFLYFCYRFLVILFFLSLIFYSTSFCYFIHLLITCFAIITLCSLLSLIYYFVLFSSSSLFIIFILFSIS